MTTDDFKLVNKYLERTSRFISLATDLDGIVSSVSVDLPLTLLVAVVRRSAHTLSAVRKLLINDEETHADNALALVRKMIEDYTSIEYIRFKGKTEYSKLFYDFQIVELHGYYQEYLQLYPDLKDDLDIAYAQTLNNFANLSSKLQTNKSWAGISTQKMYQQLVDAKVWKDRDAKLMAIAYLFGCKVIHTSPDDLSRFQDPAFHATTNIKYAKTALIFGALAIYKLSDHLCSDLLEIKGDSEVAKIKAELNSIFMEMHAD